MTDYLVNYDAQTISLDGGDLSTEPDFVSTKTIPTLLDIENNTITLNEAYGKLNETVLVGARGGGIALIDQGSPLFGTVIISNTIIAENSVSPTIGFGPDIWVHDDDSIANNGTHIPGDDNLISSTGGEFDLVAIVDDPELEILDFYGGPIKTHMLKGNSPAIDKGNALVYDGSTNITPMTTPTVTLNFDQRGAVRSVEHILTDNQYAPRADIGSYELESNTLRVLSVTTNSPPQQSMITSITIVFSETISLPGTPSTPESAFKLERTGPGTLVGVVNLSAALSGNMVTLTFLSGGTVGIDPAGSLIDGIYKLSITGKDVTSTVTTVGNPSALATLDANGDGIGDSTEVYTLTGNQDNGLFRLFGDGDGNGVVNNIDFALFRATFGLSAPHQDFNFAFDYNGDGSVNNVDFAQFRARFGLNYFP